VKTYHLIALLVGLALSVGLLALIRRAHLYIRQGLFWISVSAVSLVFGAWPFLVDAIGQALDIGYPPVLLLLAGIVALTVKALLGDIAQTRLKRDLRRLNQRVAMLEAQRPPGPDEPLS
jgi:hypothetical protein